jgi:hypothetical protein
MPFVDRGELNAMLAETVAGGIGGGFQGLVSETVFVVSYMFGVM